MRKILCSLLSIGAASVLILGCASRLDRTHRGDLLDAKVDAQRVEAALKSSGPDYQKIQVDATNDIVVLSGTVSSEEVRLNAEKIAKSVHRELELKDELKLEGEDTNAPTR